MHKMRLACSARRNIDSVSTGIVARVTSRIGVIIATGHAQSRHASGVGFYWRISAKIHDKSQKNYLCITINLSYEQCSW